MKNNMKGALTTISVPYAVSFLDGMFLWGLPEGFYILVGFAMLVGIVWAWIVESNR
jgi:hypothetical protein